MRLVLACAFLCLAAAGVRADTLTLRFTGLKGDGPVVVALFGSEGDFGADRPVATARAVPRGNAATVTFHSLPAGRYAVKSFQDGDNNGRLSLNLLGIPREPYAFSNDARGRFGPPSWEAAAFALPPKGAAQTIRLD